MIGLRCGTGSPTRVRWAIHHDTSPKGKLIKNTQRHDRYSVM